MSTPVNASTVAGTWAIILVTSCEILDAPAPSPLPPPLLITPMRSVLDNGLEWILFRFGGLAHRGFEFALAARHFLLLHLDLFLFGDDLDLHLLLFDLLIRDIFLQIVGKFGSRFLLVHLRVIRGFLDLK